MQIRNDSKESVITLKNKSMKDPVPLPGVLQNISIGGEILWDTAGTQGNNNQKTTKGYKEKIVTITLLLLGKKSKTTFHILDKIIGDEPKTPYQVLGELEQLFRETEDSAKKIAESSTTPSVDTDKKDNIPQNTTTPSTDTDKVEPSKEAISIMPSIYMIDNGHINNRGIDKVCFTSLNSSENNAKDYITVSLTFEEFDSTSYTANDVVEESTDKSPV